MLLERQDLVKTFKNDIGESLSVRFTGRSGCSIDKILIYNDIKVVETNRD